ncbi:S-protein2 [Sesamum alatum]|uniref:S-protein homolog n=1 Tax=Sesamum alatum TaxID=300844 RepID=A0AAE2CVC7_9LAMI|nr:S-protein2 [Sesamum alatum]
MAIEQDKKCFLTQKYTVHIENHLPWSSHVHPLHLHCASKDDDLGYHNLTPFGEFSWSFCKNFWDSTLFFCHLWWNSLNGTKHKGFNVFDRRWAARCISGSCYWAANGEGIEFTGHDPPINWEKIYDWDNGTGI